MRVGNTRRAAMAVASVAVAALVLASCSAAAASPPPPPSASSGLIQNRVIPAAIAQVPMTDQHGQTVTLASLQGKTLMIVPSLTLCTDICPMTTENLVQVHRALVRAGVASNVAIVEVSVDPVRDTVARLAAYAQLTGADWYLTTETPADLAELAAYFGFYYHQVPEDNPPSIDWLTHQPLTYDIVHSDGYVLVTPAGHMVFSNAAAPAFHGTLPPKLRHFLSAEGVDHLKHPPQPDWTPADALAALAWTIGKPLPAST
ncbi:MAG: SCO family protein [Acidimicrobiales bacterium]